MSGARFSFTSPDFQVEFRGSEEFVAEQVALVRPRIKMILSTLTQVEVPAGETVPGAAAERPSLENFYLKAKTREGRGALQDSILIFAHYMQEHQGKHEFSIEDLNFCFDLLNIQRPKSLANTLGILKRDRRLLHSGSRRGTYALAEKGQERVQRLIR